MNCRFNIVMRYSHISHELCGDNLITIHNSYGRMIMNKQMQKTSEQKIV